MTAVEVAHVTLHRAGGAIPRLANARASWDRRESIVVALHDGEGRVGLGEAAPLPGISVDSLDEVESELRNWKLAGAVEADAEGCGWFASEVRRDVAWPAARFALELAMVDLVGQVKGTPASQLVMLTLPAYEVAVSALLGDAGAPGAIERARDLVHRGARTLKLKLGSRTISYDLAAVKALRTAIGPEIALVGDANAAWSNEVARVALDLLARFDVAYVEQPVPPETLATLGPTAIPVWADESLFLESSRWGVVAAPHVAGVVCKPTLLGGLRACIDVALLATRAGKGVVVTHTLEGPVALAGCAALALSLGAIAPRAGLWPHDALAAYPEVALPGYADGKLIATDRPGLGFTEDERRLLLALPRIEDLR